MSSSGAQHSKKSKIVTWVPILLIMVSLLIPAKYDDVKVYLTADRVTAHVDECRYSSAGRGSGWRCTGTWTLRDGTTGRGKLQGLEDNRASGAPVAVYATRNRAVTDSWSHISIFALGVAALLALVGFGVWKWRRL